MTPAPRTTLATGSPPAGANPAAAALRVLVVAPTDATAQAVQQVLHAAGIAAQVERVEGYLLALGRVATPPTPDVLITLAEWPDGGTPPANVPSALRTLAPTIRLLLLARPMEEPAAIAGVRSGFDDYLIQPLDPMEVARAIGKNWPVSRISGGPCPVSKDQATNDSDTAPSESSSAPNLKPPRAQASNSLLDAGHGTRDTGQDLGDIDLVQRLLGRKDIRSLALQLVSSRCGLPVAWGAQIADVPAGHASAMVEFAGLSLGLLHAPPPATAEALTPWAQWLSYWLALDGRVAILWNMAMRDELTGAWNRRYFSRFLAGILPRALAERFRVTLLVFDIDNFKTYNDRFGHDAGDEILRETTRLMQSLVREQDVVARVGGDEFAVIFWDAEDPRRPNSEHPADVRKVAQRFQHAISQHRFPKLSSEAPGTLTISGGLASFPWDGQTPETLLKRADEMAIQSKRQGKNVITFGPGTERNQ